MHYKKINSEYFYTILDRLTRFEPAKVKFERVLGDILNKFYLEKRSDLSIEEKINVVNEIIDFSCEKEMSKNSSYINSILLKLEEKYFDFDELSYQYLSSRFNFDKLLNEIDDYSKMTKNVLWLKKVFDNEISFENLDDFRQKENLLYPIEKIILCEGQTEITLLETIFNLYNVDFNKKGIYVIPAGGKNQVARKYYSMIEYTKIPIIVLLDKDAKEITELIYSKLRQKDTIYLIKSGEFEDLIPKNILQKTINLIHQNEYSCNFDDFKDDKSMVENLENIYRKYGFGEFKKARFALQLKEYIKNNVTQNDFLNSEIPEIVGSLHI